MSQQGVIPTAFDATSVAPCLGDPSATPNAPTLTRVIPNRPTTASRARLVSGTLGSSLPLRLPTLESVSTRPFFSVPSTTLCFQDRPANLRTSQKAASLASQPVSATRTCAMPTMEVQWSFLRETGERCRGLSHKGLRRGAKIRQLEMKFRGTTYRRMICKETRSRERRANIMISVETKSRGMKLGRMKSRGKSHHVVNQCETRWSLPEKCLHPQIGDHQTRLPASNASHAEVSSIRMLSATNLTPPTPRRCRRVGQERRA